MQFLTILAVVLGLAAHGERLTAFGATPAFRQVPPVQPATPQAATPRPQRRSVANATLAIIVWHFYHVIFDPDVYPVNFAFWDGRMSEDLYREEHELAYEETQKPKDQEEEPR